MTAINEKLILLLVQLFSPVLGGNYGKLNRRASWAAWGDAQSLGTARRGAERKVSPDLGTALTNWLATYLFSQGYEKLVAVDNSAIKISFPVSLPACVPFFYFVVCFENTEAMWGSKFPAFLWKEMVGRRSLAVLLVKTWLSYFLLYKMRKWLLWT